MTDASIEDHAGAVGTVASRREGSYARLVHAVTSCSVSVFLLSDERRKTGWMRAEAAGDPRPWRIRLFVPGAGTRTGFATLCGSLLSRTSTHRTEFWSLMRPDSSSRARHPVVLRVNKSGRRARHELPDWRVRRLCVGTGSRLYRSSALFAGGFYFEVRNPRFYRGLIPFPGRHMMNSYQHLGLDERRDVYRLVATGRFVREVAAALRRHPSTISREFKRTRHLDEHPLFRGYFPTVAQNLARERRVRGDKIARKPELATYIADRLSVAWSHEQTAAHNASPDGRSWHDPRGCRPRNNVFPSPPGAFGHPVVPLPNFCDRADCARRGWWRSLSRMNRPLRCAAAQRRA